MRKIVYRYEQYIVIDTGTDLLVRNECNGYIQSRIHNYFFARSLDKVRPGGVIAFITSTGTMDAADQNVRNYLSQRANLVAAIRLPSNTFKDNAGTEVTSDLIILQKLKEGDLPGNTDWVKTGMIDVDGKEIKINQYFIDNPHMMLGEVVEDKLYGNRIGLKSNVEDIRQALSDVIEAHIPEKILNNKPTQRTHIEVPEEVRAMAENAIEGTVVKQGDKLYRKIGKELVPITENVEQIKDLANLRDHVKEILNLQRQENVSTKDLESKHAAMKKLYDAYVKKHGKLLQRKSNNGKLQGRYAVETAFGYSREIKVKNKKGQTVTKTIFTIELESYLLKSLEIEDMKSDKDGNQVQEIKPSLILTSRTCTPAKTVDKVTTAEDGLITSINEYGYVDMDHISSIYGKSEDAIIKELGDKIYKNPMGNWETSDEYLSGNVRKKLKQAQEASSMDAQYERNVEALEKVIPKDIPFTDIEVNLGDAWVPMEVQSAAILRRLGFGPHSEGVKMEYSPFDNTWSVKQGKSSQFRVTPEMKDMEAGHGIGTLKVMKIALNNGDTTVKYEHEGFHSKSAGKLTDKQLEATIWLHKHIRSEVKRIFGIDIPIDREHIVGHYQINPITKPNCPGANFQWNMVIKALKEDDIMGKIFKDIEDSRWSAKDIEKAINLGLIKGNDDGTFNPTGSVTREQVAVLLIRLYEKLGGK